MTKLSVALALIGALFCLAASVAVASPDCDK